MIESFIKNNRLKIKVRPNSPKTEITGHENHVIRVNVAAPADKDKANRELIKFLSKLLKKKVRIASGLKSREKVLEII